MLVGLVVVRAGRWYDSGTGKSRASLGAWFVAFDAGPSQTLLCNWVQFSNSTSQPAFVTAGLWPGKRSHTIIIGVDRRSTDKRSKDWHNTYSVVSFFFSCCYARKRPSPFYLIYTLEKPSFNDKVWTIDFLSLVFFDLSTATSANG